MIKVFHFRPKQKGIFYHSIDFVSSQQEKLVLSYYRKQLVKSPQTVQNGFIPTLLTAGTKILLACLFHVHFTRIRCFKLVIKKI